MSNKDVPMGQAPKQATWEEIVARSNGMAMFLPDALVEKAKVWQAKRNDFQGRINDMAKLEVETSVLLNELMLEFRQYCEKATGGKHDWTTDIGFSTDALKDGKFVVNMTPSGK